MNGIKKALFTLSIDNYEPEITALTFPLMKMYAYKIGADFCIIDKRKLTLPEGVMAGGFPGLEKFQIYELGRELKNDWNIFIDPDALIHPDFFDPTTMMHKDTTAAYEFSDFAPVRFRPDQMFMRDGRMSIGKGNWFGICSDWCLDYFHPLDDITLDEAMEHCSPTLQELTAEKPMSKFNMVEDFIVSRNIARYGLKHVLVSELLTQRGKTLHYVPQTVQTPQGKVMQHGGPVMHQYLPSAEQKVVLMKKQLDQWGLEVKA